MHNVNETSVFGYFHMPGRRFQFASDNIRQNHFPVYRIKAVYIYMIHPLICHQQIFIVMGHSRAVDMGTEIPFRKTSKPLMVYFIRNVPDGAVALQA